MKIGMILENSFPPDIRVEKEARSLIKAGHEIHLLAINSSHEQRDEKINGICVHRFIIIPKDKKTLLFKIKIGLTNIFHYSKIWTKGIQELIDRYQIEALHTHDLPLMGTAVMVAKENKIPLVADLHENYPAAVKVWVTFNNIRQITKYFADCLALWSLYEKKILPYCDHIIVVVPEAKKRLKKLNPSSKITVVSNTEDIDYFKSIKIDIRLVDEYKDDFIISYIGGFGPHRGINTAIQAMPKVINKIPHAKLLLVGGKDNDKKFKKITEDLNLQEKVIFIDWQKFDTVATYIYLSSICLIPHHKSPHTNTTIPHKLFQYMLMKKPVIVSNCKPLERIVKETSSGLVFKSGNSDNLAQKIYQIYKNPDRYGENGHQAVIDKYNWENESKKLITIYKQLKKKM